MAGIDFAEEMPTFSALSDWLVSILLHRAPSFVSRQRTILLAEHVLDVLALGER